MTAKLPLQLPRRLLKKLVEQAKKEKCDGVPDKVYGTDWADVHELVGLQANGCFRTRARIEEERTL
jgi:hypothetical protein